MSRLLITGLVVVLLGVVASLLWWGTRPAPAPAQGAPVAVDRPVPAVHPSPGVAPAAAPATPVAPPATPPATDEVRVRTLVTQAADPAVPEERRVAAIGEAAAAAAKGDATAVRALVAVADSGAYLAPQAVRALGEVATPAAQAYVDHAVTQGNPMIAAAAVRALAPRGAAAVPLIEQTMLANQRRNDGYQDVICAAAIEALADTRAPEAVAPMARALAAIVADSTLSYPHAEKIVAATQRLGRAEAVPALQRHIERLRQDRDAMTDNPMGRGYLDGLIAQTSDVIATLNRPMGTQP